jgi:hypothetical protein
MGILSGKTAVVTGSTSGIGLAYARKFASEGANIVLNGMGAPADIEKERSAIEGDFKVKAVHSPADMTKPAEIAGMIALGEKSFRPEAATRPRAAARRRASTRTRAPRTAAPPRWPPATPTAPAASAARRRWATRTTRATTASRPTARVINAWAARARSTAKARR